MTAMSEFINEEMLLEELPRYEQVKLHGLEKKYLWSSMFSNGIFMLLLLGGAIGLPFIFSELEDYSIYLVLFWMLLAAVSTALVVFGFHYKGYALRNRDVIFREGLVFRSTAVVPFNRVQHAEVNQGPVDRLLNLSSLHIYTAGGSSSDLSIPGLTPERAQQLRDFIIIKTTTSDEEE
jgi:membrane protein YdbS with pleckstrin-like domain